MVDIDYHRVKEPPSINGDHKAYSSHFVNEPTEKQLVSNYSLRAAIGFSSLRVSSKWVDCKNRMSDGFREPTN